MKKAKNISASPKQIKGKKAIYITTIVWVLAIAVIGGGCSLLLPPNGSADSIATVTTEPTEETTVAETEPTQKWETGFVAAFRPSATYCDGAGTPLGTIPRGTQVEYAITPDGRTELLFDGVMGYLQEGAYIVSDTADVIPHHTLYVRTAVNLRDIDGRLLGGFADKGAAVDVTGCDYVYADGGVHMYRVSLDGKEGYIMPWYLADNEGDALVNFDDGSYAIHADRGDRYGGGGAANLDTTPGKRALSRAMQCPRNAAPCIWLPGVLARWTAI